MHRQGARDYVLAHQADRGGTGTGTTSQGFANAAFVNTQSDIGTILYFRETDIDTLRKYMGGLNRFSPALDRNIQHAVDPKDRMRIAHGDGGKRMLLSIQRQKILRRIGFGQ
jgi:hypothetical protein